MSDKTGLNFKPKFHKAVSIKNRERPMDVERLSKILVFYFDNDWSETVAYAESIGFVSIRGTPMSAYALTTHLNKFMIRHPDVVREVFIENQNRFLHDPLGDNDWYEFIVSLATRWFKGKPDFIRWAVRNGYYKDAFDIFKDKYNLTEQDRTAFD